MNKKNHLPIEANICVDCVHSQPVREMPIQFSRTKKKHSKWMALKCKCYYHIAVYGIVRLQRLWVRKNRAKKADVERRYQNIALLLPINNFILQTMLISGATYLIMAREQASLERWLNDVLILASHPSTCGILTYITVIFSIFFFHSRWNVN